MIEYASDRDILKMFFEEEACIFEAKERPPEVQFIRLTEETSVSEYGEVKVYPLNTYVTLRTGSVYPDFHTPEEFNTKYETI